MLKIKNISPNILKTRHRLSAWQINDIAGTAIISETIEEKVTEINMVKEFLSLVNILKETNVDFIPLKGPVLSFKLYGDATARCYHDLDFLIDENAIRKVDDIMQRLEYKPFGRSWPQKRKEQRIMLKYSHYISYIHPERKITVETHWKLINSLWMSYLEQKKLLSGNIAKLLLPGMILLCLRMIWNSYI